MATDFSYAKELGIDEKAVTAARTAANPRTMRIAGALAIDERAAYRILDEIANVPTAPAAPTATPTVAGTASVAFAAPAANGSPITGYEVTASTGQVATGTASPIVISGVTAGAGRTFTVKAINDIGKSAASAASVGVTIT